MPFDHVAPGRWVVTATMQASGAGGAASELWLQVLADVWGTEVRRRTIVAEPNSLGAAVGLVDFPVARELSEVTATFTPSPDRHAAYQRRNAEFTAAHRRLEPWFEEVKR